MMLAVVVILLPGLRKFIRVFYVFFYGANCNGEKYLSC